MNTYNAYFNRKIIEVEAETSAEAQSIAAKLFKAKKSWMVTVILAAKNGKPVEFNPGAI
jgi:hypothetical protein